MKKLLSFLLIPLLVALGFSSCGQKMKHQEEKFELSKEQILQELGSMEGKIVDVIGDIGPYRSDYTLHCNYGEGKGTDWTSKGGHKLEYPHERDFYHLIHVYVNKDGGALLVGRRIAVPSKEKSEQAAPHNP